MRWPLRKSSGFRVDIEDCSLVAPVRGPDPVSIGRTAGGSRRRRAGARPDRADRRLYDTVLPRRAAGRAAIGAEARIILDAAPEWVAPATMYYVAAEAQFTPETVETAEERQKLAFQVRVRFAADLLRQYEPMVKIGIPGVVYVRLDPAAQWPTAFRFTCRRRRSSKRVTSSASVVSLAAINAPLRRGRARSRASIWTSRPGRRPASSVPTESANRLSWP